MKKGIYIITAALFLTMFIYGCTAMDMLPFGDKDEVDVGPRTETSKLFFRANILQPQVYPGSSTALTIRIENPWEEALTDVDVTLEGFAYAVGSAPTPPGTTSVYVSHGNRSMGDIGSGMIGQTQFTITMPRTFVTNVNIVPRICFDYTQLYGKDVILVPDHSTAVGSEISPDGPLTMRIAKNTIMASGEIFPVVGNKTEPIDEFIDYSISRKGVDQIVSLKKITVNVQNDSVLKGIRDISFVEKAKDDIEWTCLGLKPHDSCTLSTYIPRQQDTLTGIMTLSIGEPVTSNQYRTITIEAEGRYCVVLPPLTLSVRQT